MCKALSCARLRTRLKHEAQRIVSYLRSVLIQHSRHPCAPVCSLCTAGSTHQLQAQAFKGPRGTLTGYCLRNWSEEVEATSSWHIILWLLIMRCFIIKKGESRLIYNSFFKGLLTTVTHINTHKKWRWPHELLIWFSNGFNEMNLFQLFCRMFYVEGVGVNRSITKFSPGTWNSEQQTVLWTERVKISAMVALFMPVCNH